MFVETNTAQTNTQLNFCHVKGCFAVLPLAVMIDAKKIASQTRSYTTQQRRNAESYQKALNCRYAARILNFRCSDCVGSLDKRIVCRFWMFGYWHRYIRGLFHSRRMTSLVTTVVQPTPHNRKRYFYIVHRKSIKKEGN